MHVSNTRKIAFDIFIHQHRYMFLPKTVGHFMHSTVTLNSILLGNIKW